MINNNIANRFGLYKDLLKSSKYFKLVCGAGNGNKDEVEYLTYIYTLAGCTGFDVLASPEIVQAAKNGINSALKKAAYLTIEIPHIPIITVSVGMPGDHHVRKAVITNDCISCNRCIPACPTYAIQENLLINHDLCIGCGDCEAACPPSINGINYSHNSKELLSLLPACLEAGAESIELHAAVADNASTLKEWKVIADSLPNGMISMCLDRKHLSNDMLIERIISAYEIANDRLIIQADGIAMSGREDNFNTTLQAISITDFLNKELKEKNTKFKDLPILISGGTNSLTGKLARQCNINFNGISIGTHARKIISSFKGKPEEIEKEELLLAINQAKSLVDINLYK